MKIGFLRVFFCHTLFTEDKDMNGFMTILAEESMQFDPRFFLDLVLILFSTKFLGIIMKKMGLPQVLGALIAGILLGIPIINGHGIVSSTPALATFAAIGVNLIMFSAGMETNFKEIKKNGVASVLITSLGVIVPFVLGFAVSFVLKDSAFNPEADIMKQRMFFGVILTATSVGITVAALKELGVLHGKVGASIVTAAILDDIIGIVILAFFTADIKATTIGYKIVDACGGNPLSASLAPVSVLLNVLFFFLIGIGLGVAIHFAFKFMAKKFPHTRRLSIFGLVICFLYAWGAEELFGVAAITGSFLAGMMLSNMRESEYVERRIDMSAYMMFSPIFFANIGIAMPYDKLISSFQENAGLIIGFSVLFVFAGLASKLLGCGAGAAMCKYKPNQCVKVGVGMMVRGEVCLIVTQAGVDAGLIKETYYPAIILLIVLSSILTPIILKIMFRKYPNEVLPAEKMGTLDTVEREQSTIQGVEAVIYGHEEEKSVVAYDATLDPCNPRAEEPSAPDEGQQIGETPAEAGANAADSLDDEEKD